LSSDAGEYTVLFKIYDVIGGGYTDTSLDGSDSTKQPRRSTNSANMAKPFEGFSKEAVVISFK
jgi:hypothetical protein